MGSRPPDRLHKITVAVVVLLALLAGCTTGPSTTTESPVSTETTGIQSTTSNTDAGLSYRLKLIGESSNVSTFTLTLRKKPEGQNSTVLKEDYNLSDGETIDLSEEIRSQETYHVSITFENGNTSSVRVFSDAGLTLYIGDDKIVRSEKEIL